MIAFHTGVFLVLVYQVFPGRSPDVQIFRKQKRAPGIGPLALLILFGLFNNSIDCL